MAQTQVIIIYSPNQNVRRRVIIPDDDNQISIHSDNIAKGEAVLIGNIQDYQMVGPDAMLAAHTGQQAATDRCIVISPNAINPTVAAVVRGDPLIDVHPLGRLAIDITGQAAVGMSVVNGVAVIQSQAIS